MSEVKSIPLSNSDKCAYVDADDYENVMKYKWRYLNGYCKSTIDNKSIFLHQFILGRPPIKDNVIDHKNNDTLDNTRKNLRFATQSQNSQNRAKREWCTSKYIGVTWSSTAKKWRTLTSTTYLGSFDDEIEAAKKYDTYTFLKYGEDSRTNNLVKYEDVKDIDINTLSCKRTQDLPKNISRKRSAFVVVINYKKQVFRSSQPTMEKAVQKLEEFQAEIQNIKKNEDNNHNNKEIVRNDDGIAIIPIMNKKGDICDYSTVSDDKWHLCMKYSWSMSHGYACGNVEGTVTRMNRFISGAIKDTIVDHIDNKKLNNTNENLRITNHGVNNHNKTKKKNASSQYFGVYFIKLSETWRSEIRKDNKRYNVGHFQREIDAAKAYNIKAKELYGDCAKLNVF